MSRFFNRLILLVALALAFVAPAVRADSLVTLKPATEVNSPSIRLSDVFSGIPDTIDRPIATAPAPGKNVTYDVRILANLAKQYRLDWQPQSTADHATLTRASAKITQDMVRAAVIEKLKTQDIKGKTEIQFDNHALEVDLPADRAPKFTLNNFDYDSLNKRFHADLSAETGASPVVLPVTGHVLIKRDVPVLTRRLEAGTTIGEADVDWLTVPEERLSGDFITEKSQLIGRELRHDAADNQPLHSRDIIPPRLVTRGGLVIMKIQTPYLLITAQGRALQDGTTGDVVRVTNTQSYRVLEGTVEGPGVIRIQTSQKLALAQ